MFQEQSLHAVRHFFGVGILESSYGDHYFIILDTINLATSIVS
jgi:hypothetical protein